MNKPATLLAIFWVSFAVGGCASLDSYGTSSNSKSSSYAGSNYPGYTWGADMVATHPAPRVTMTGNASTPKHIAMCKTAIGAMLG